MIVKVHVEKDLRRLNALYNASIASSSSDDPVYYSKLAVLEFSGWVEESFDAIAIRAAKGKLKTTKFQNILKEVVKKNSGFTYDNHFLSMLSKVVGLPACEKLHREMDSDGSIAILRAELDAVVQQRNKAAHINLANTTVSFDTPSIYLGRQGRLNKVYPVLRKMYSQFC